MDLERLKNNNDWIKAFYRHSNEDVETAIALVDEVFTWRKNTDTNSLILPGKLPVGEELFKKGLIFVKNEDINCIPMSKFL
jgi:hypothetical protein